MHFFFPIRRLKPSVISTDEICNHLRGTLPLCVRHYSGILMFPSLLTPIICIKCGFIMEPQHNPLLMRAWHWLIILVLPREIPRLRLSLSPCRKEDVLSVCLYIVPFVAINILTFWV